MELTQEQKRIIASEEDLVINAVAGSGKTTTILEYARRRTNKRILYLVFNKSAKQKAQQLFMVNHLTHVSVETAHSLAYRFIIPGSAYRIRAGYRPAELVLLLNIPTDRPEMLHLKIAHHVLEYYHLFCSQTASAVVDIDYPSGIVDASARVFVRHHHDEIIYYTRLLLARMDQGAIEITHDFYLKKFQLMHPILPYDIILFDEGQDASPVMLDVFYSQRARRVIIGDSYQQIYGWRNAVNALENAHFNPMLLSCSFRFGNDIARLARSILSLKSLFMPAPQLRITGIDQNRPIHSRAYIARTNAGLLNKAIEVAIHHHDVKQLYFEGNLSSYVFTQAGSSLYDLLNLYTNQRHKISDSLILSMPSFDDLQHYAACSGDASLKMLIDLVMRYEDQLPDYIRRLEALSCMPEERDRAEMVFSTVHKSKGMEYDEVFVSNDFTNEQALLDQIPALRSGLTQINLLSEEVNMLYVAVTRTRTRLHIPSELLPTGVATGKSTGVTTNMTLQRANGFKATVAASTNSWTRTEDSELRHLFVSGKPLRQIAFLLNRTPEIIQHRIEKLRLWEKF